MSGYPGVGELEDAITAYKRVPAGIPDLPDLHARIDDLAAEEDRVYARLTVTGTNTGRFSGVPPTGRPFALFAVIVVSTALFQAPQHRALSGGFDRGSGRGPPEEELDQDRGLVGLRAAWALDGLADRFLMALPKEVFSRRPGTR
ncbi:MAG: ester cyclase [Actinobacteria bacterium]|nr:ester cyclase [Actinomycetota bacterium]